jgi:hypothetical protein
MTSYLLAMTAFSALIFGVAWAVTGLLGVDGDARLIVSSQAPVVGVLLLWFAAIYWGPPQS